MTRQPSVGTESEDADGSFRPRWNEFKTIPYDPALDFSQPIRCAENSGGGEPLQTGGEQENRASESADEVAGGGAGKGPEATNAPAQASGIGATGNAEDAASAGWSTALSRVGTQSSDFSEPAEAGTPAGSGAIDRAQNKAMAICAGRAGNGSGPLGPQDRIARAFASIWPA